MMREMNKEEREFSSKEAKNLNPLMGSVSTKLISVSIC
jgi:hypothetical protein